MMYITCHLETNDSAYNLFEKVTTLDMISIYMSHYFLGKILSIYNIAIDSI